MNPARIPAASSVHESALTSQDGDGPDTASVTELVRKLFDAQSRHDVPTLRSLTAEQFVEISPLGDVDPRDMMLSFYGGEASPARPGSASGVSAHTASGVSAHIRTQTHH